ncbi:unnamed protein product [Didymodactylos carnosus]|uniref:TTF-type domain-containing protein n=1 Tax=Didymodactylos carnosus TaxID=1234261 RepID=A0A813U7X4_9BILA|nr:unnamed protein product [Didymodactylos carnosus]CAF3608941.1 unnamed protein product [Didymodactylos carnosus]
MFQSGDLVAGLPMPTNILPSNNSSNLSSTIVQSSTPSTPSFLTINSSVSNHSHQNNQNSHQLHQQPLSTIVLNTVNDQRRRQAAFDALSQLERYHNDLQMMVESYAIDSSLSTSSTTQISARTHQQQQPSHTDKSCQSFPLLCSTSSAESTSTPSMDLPTYPSLCFNQKSSLDISRSVQQSHNKMPNDLYLPQNSNLLLQPQSAIATVASALLQKTVVSTDFLSSPVNITSSNANNNHNIIFDRDPAGIKPQDLDDTLRWLLIQVGPHQPKNDDFNMSIFPSPGNKIVRFRAKWFDDVRFKDWLEYSLKSGRAYCFYCRMFADTNRNRAFARDGVKNWRKCLGSRGRKKRVNHHRRTDDNNSKTISATVQTVNLVNISEHGQSELLGAQRRGLFEGHCESESHRQAHKKFKIFVEKMNFESQIQQQQQIINQNQHYSDQHLLKPLTIHIHLLQEQIKREGGL